MHSWGAFFCWVFSSVGWFSGFSENFRVWVLEEHVRFTLGSFLKIEIHVQEI
jgi:hypothetical protein